MQGQGEAGGSGGEAGQVEGGSQVSTRTGQGKGERVSDKENT